LCRRPGGSGGRGPPRGPCFRRFHRDLRNRDCRRSRRLCLRRRGSRLLRLRRGRFRRRSRGRRSPRCRCRRRRSLRWRSCRLRQCDSGEAEQHERRAAQQQQTPAMDRHHTPPFLTETIRQSRPSTHDGESSAAWGIGLALARRERGPRPQSMSGDGRCARAEQRGV
jgi:hypothetical protein